MLFSKTKICIFHLKSINPQNMGGGGLSLSEDLRSEEKTGEVENETQR